MIDQPALFEGVRIDPPACYDEIAEAIENAIGNGFPEILSRSDSELMDDIFWNAGIDPNHSPDDIEQAIRIYRERISKVV